MPIDKSENMTANIEIEFPEYLTPPTDPIPFLKQKFQNAFRAGIREPTSVSLATSTREGVPSIRTISIKTFSDTGIIFTTHSSSRKGKELAENPVAAILSYWRESSEQISVIGKVIKLDDSIADEMWDSRPTFTHSMSVASMQSDVLNDIAELRQKDNTLSQMGKLPRPDRYAVYEVVPIEIEFWANGINRLHERLLYVRNDDAWVISRLQP